MESQRFFLRVACISGALAVILGAFGAHGLENRLSAEMLDTYETGVKYHFYHAIATLALAAGSANLWQSAWTKRACWSWTAGTVVFSGSLYVLTITDLRWLGAITPIGGVAMIVGWAMAAAAARHS